MFCSRPVRQMPSFLRFHIRKKKKKIQRHQRSWGNMGYSFSTCGTQQNQMPTSDIRNPKCREWVCVCVCVSEWVFVCVWQSREWGCWRYISFIFYTNVKGDTPLPVTGNMGHVPRAVQHILVALFYTQPLRHRYFYKAPQAILKH